MDEALSADEVLEVAEQIERNGAKFYRCAAARCEDPNISALFVQLGQWEARHVQVFKEMRAYLSKQKWDIGDLGPDRAPSARALAGLAIFGRQAGPSEGLTGRETRAEVFRKAIEKEKESIVYYAGLKDLVPTQRERQMVEDIIQEEMKHVRILMQSLERLE
jgi:rubrerythrin